MNKKHQKPTSTRTRSTKPRASSKARALVILTESSKSERHSCRVVSVQSYCLGQIRDSSVSRGSDSSQRTRARLVVGKRIVLIETREIERNKEEKEDYYPAMEDATREAKG